MLAPEENTFKMKYYVNIQERQIKNNEWVGMVLGYNGLMLASFRVQLAE